MIYSTSYEYDWYNSHTHLDQPNAECHIVSGLVNWTSEAQFPMPDAGAEIMLLAMKRVFGKAQQT